MKKCLYLIAAAALALVACAKEEAYEPEGMITREGKKITIGASFELPLSNTKSDYDAAGNFTWSDDDAIWVGTNATSGENNWGSGAIMPAESEVGPGYKRAKFDCTIPGEYTAVAAVFPKTVQPSYSTGTLSLTLPKTIAWTDTQLADPANATMQVDNVMVARFVDIYENGYAQGTYNGLQFYNVGGLFCLTLKNIPVGADKLIFTADQKINGSFAVSNVVNLDDNKNYPQIETTSTETESEKSITITFPSITNGENKMTFFIPVPVGSYVIGFDVQKEDGTSVWKFSASKANGVERGHIVKMPTLSHVVVGGDGDGATNIITTPTAYSGTVHLPSTTNNIYVRMNTTDGTINLAYTDIEGALHPENVYLQALGNINTININLPDSHVELTGEDAVTHVITNVSSYTSFSTLKVDGKVKIGKDDVDNSGLTVTGGSLDLAAPVDGRVKVDIPETVLNTTEEKVSINIASSIKKLDVKRAANKEAANKIYVTIAQAAKVKDSLAVPETNCNLYVANGAEVKVVETKATENTVEGKVETLAASGESTVVTVTKAGSVTESITSADKATVVIEDRTVQEVADGDAGEIVSGENVTTLTEGNVITVSGTVVAYIGSTPYTSLQAAITAAKAGDEIVIQASHTVTCGYTIEKNLTINLNGNTITANAASNDDSNFPNNRLFKVTGSANLTVKNGTTVLNDKLWGSVRFESTGNLVLTDYVTYNYREYGANIKMSHGNATFTNVKIYADKGGCVDIGDGSYDAPSHAVAEMTNCTFEQTGEGSTGEYKTVSTAVIVSCSGHVTLNSGSYSGYYGLFPHSSGGTITVKDGCTVTGRENAVHTVDLSTTYINVHEDHIINIQGGTINGTFDVATDGHTTFTVTGGTFDHDPTAFVAEGYIANGNNPWTVIKREGAVTNLAELQEAISNNVTPIYYVGEAITEAFTLAPSVATTINGLKVNHQTVAANATTLTINGDVTLNEADIISKAYCAVSVAAEKTVTLKDCVVDGSTAAADNSRAMNINAGSTVTIDGSTVKGPATAGYSRCINVLGDGAHVDIVNGSLLSVSHYAFNLPSTAVNAVINVNGSSVNTGWAITNIWKTGNTITFTNCTLNSVNDKTYDKDGWNDFSAFVFNNDGTNISSGNVVTVNNCAVSVSSTKGNRQSLISMRGNGDTIKFIGTDGTISLAENGGITYQWGQLHSVLNNTLSFDDANYEQIEESIDAACIVTTANNLHTITYVTEVYYYWDTDNGQQGSYCSLADPFVKGWLSDGEYIRLERNVSLTANITATFTQYLTAGHFFTLTFGNYSITKGEYSIILPAGLSVKTDKQTDVFTAAAGAEIVETVENNVYTYTSVAKTYVAQIGSTKYETLVAAVAAVPENEQTTITMIANETMAENTEIHIPATKNIVLDLNGKTISSTGGSPSASYYFIQNRGTLEITDSSTGGKITSSCTVPSPGYSKEYVTIYNIGGTLTLTAGTVETTSGGLSYAINNSSNAWGNGDDKETVFNMTGGTINSPSGDAGLRVYQNCAQNANPYSHNTVNISGGTIASGGIFLDNYIYNPNVNTTGAGISTNVTISGGEIHGLIDVKLRHTFNTTFTITGGTFVDSKLWVRKHSEWNSVVAEPTDPLFFISGGNFSFTQNKAFGLAYDCSGTSWSSYTNPYSITGGTFNVDPTTFVAPGYAATGNGPWTVVEAPIEAGEGSGRTLAEAVALVKAANGGSIRMVGDDNVTSYIRVEAPTTLDLNGHTITASGPLFNYVTANLTIKDSQGNGTMNVNVGSSRYGIRSDKSGVKVKLEGGTLSAYSTTSSYVHAVAVSSGATFEMTGGKITVPSTSTAGYNYCIEVGSNSNAIISGGEIIDEATGGIYTINNSGSVTISGGYISGKAATGSNWWQSYFPYVLYGSGTFNISGGQIKAIGWENYGQSAHFFGDSTNASITGGLFGGVDIEDANSRAEVSSRVASGYTIVNLTSGDAEYANGYRYKVVAQ